MTSNVCQAMTRRATSARPYAKVTRSGLINSCSIAGMVLTTQAVVTELPKKKVRAMGGGGGGGGGEMAPGNFSL